MMHVIKGGWVGQTLALAKCNNSGEKKSRVRRSKEERKAMVESFIKRYQKSNNGNFPSLNLTHKEVGGSFYTVREILREIIQENRVLGPAKLTPEEQFADQLMKEYPLGTISVGAQTSLSVSSNGTHFVPDQQQNASEVLVLNSSELSTASEHQRLEDGQVTNCNQAYEEREELDKLKYKESIDAEISLSVSLNGTHFVPDQQQDASEELVLNCSEQSAASEYLRLEDQWVNIGRQADEESEESDKLTYKESIVSNFEELEASAAKITNITADVIVETFPLWSAPKSIHGSDVDQGEASNFTRALGERQTEDIVLEKFSNDSSVCDGISSAMNGSSLVDEGAATEDRKMKLELSNDSSVLDGYCSAVNVSLAHEQSSTKLSGSSPEINSNLVDDKVVANREELVLRSSTASKSRMHDVQDGMDLEVMVSCDDDVASKSSEKNLRIAEFTPINASNGTATCNTVANPSSRCVEAISGGTIVTDNINSQNDEGKPTLDRINLESWEGVSKKSAEPETNPLLAFFKSFIAAFAKFWSE